MDNNGGVVLKRARRYLGEIKTLTNSFLQDDLSDLLDKEDKLTIEGMKEKVLEKQKMLDEQNETIKKLKQYEAQVAEIPTLKSENTLLQTHLNVIKSDMELLHKRLESALNEETTKRADVEVEKKILLKKIKKQDAKMTQMVREFEAQRIEDAKKLKTYLNDLQCEISEKEEFKALVHELQKELKKKEDEKCSIQIENEIQKQQFDLQKNEVLYESKMKIEELEGQLQELKNVNSELARIKEASKSEREQYQKMKILCAQYKEIADDNKHLKDQLFTSESLLSEYERYKTQSKVKQQKIIELTTDLQNKENEIVQLKKQIHEWTSLARRYIPVDEGNESSEGLSYILLKMHAECQNLTHKKISFERQCEQMQSSINHYEDLIKKKDLELVDKNNMLQNAENNNKENLKTIEDLKNQITILEIKFRGEKRILSTAILENENNNNSVLENKNKFLEENITKLKEQIDKQKQQINLLQEESRRFEEAVESAKDVQKNMHFVLLEKDNLEKVNSELSSQLRKFQDDFRQLKRENERLLNKCFALENEMDAKKLNAELIEVRAKLAEYEALSANVTGKAADDILVLKKELETLKKQNEDIARKNTAIREFYTREIKSQREAILYILGWSIKIEKVEGEERFRFSSLYSMHDGELIFYPKKTENLNENQDSEKKENEKIQLEFDLYFDGHYATKWETDLSWQSKLKASGSYPAFLASTCILEMNAIRANSNDKIFKNSSGILLKFDF